MGVVDPLPDLLSLPVPFSHQSGLEEPLGLLFLGRRFGLSEPRCLVRELPENVGGVSFPTG